MLQSKIVAGSAAALLFCQVFLAPLTIKADEPPVTREAVCRWVAKPPTVDGNLDDLAWSTATVIDKFPSFWDGKVPEAKHATRAKLVWTAQGLYFASEMKDGDVRVFGSKHNDSLWNGDVFEMFFKPSTTQPEYFEFQVNPNSVLFESAFLERNKPVEEISKARPLGMKAVARKVKGGWVAEGMIPWSAFGPKFGAPKVGDSWSFALCRYDYVGPDGTPPVLMSSAPLTKPSFHRFEDYGQLRFEGSEPR